MSTMQEFPEIMRRAREDLTANVRGRFSPEDWGRILELARAKWEAEMNILPASPERDLKAWQTVVLDFYRSGHWGFQADHHPKRPRRKLGMGPRLLLVAFFSFTITEMTLAWLGQNYTASDEPKDAYLFFGALFLIASVFVTFLWRMRHFKSE